MRRGAQPLDDPLGLEGGRRTKRAAAATADDRSRRARGGALWGAFSIYRAGTALLFPRGRLAVAGFLTAVIGFFLLILGFGVDAILVLAGGVAAFVGAEL